MAFDEAPKNPVPGKVTRAAGVDPSPNAVGGGKTPVYKMIRPGFHFG